MTPVIERIEGTGADVLRIGSAVGQSGIPLPDVPEELAPVLEILPLQQLALHLARQRGGDPDAPRGLKKITETL
jgi:glucosamine--fructose-6-phosphate aminotransferase (isomerizing)